MPHLTFSKKKSFLLSERTMNLLENLNKSQIFNALSKFYASHRQYEILSKSLVLGSHSADHTVEQGRDHRVSESYQNYQNGTVSNQLIDDGMGEKVLVCRRRRKIRLLEGNAKYRHLKKLTCKVTLRQVFICLRPRTPCPPPILHTVYMYTVYLFTQGRRRGRGELNQREVQSGNSSQACLIICLFMNLPPFMGSTNTT